MRVMIEYADKTSECIEIPCRASSLVLNGKLFTLSAQDRLIRFPVPVYHEATNKETPCNVQP